MSNKFQYYPNYDDPKFYEKLIKKKEYYINRIPKDRKTEEELCDKSKKFQLLPQQAFLKNYINTETPYGNILIFHGTGVGKTMSSVGIAENFAEMLEKYDGKNIVLVSGNETKNNFKNNGILGRVTADKYISQEERQLKKDLEKLDTPAAREEIKRIDRRVDARIKRQGFYKILGYETFVNRTIGRILKDTKTGKDRKDEQGNLMREIVGTPLINLDNSILIVDEAHRIINENDFGEAIRETLQKSKNFRLVLLTATPMFHGPETIIEMLNLLHLPAKPSLTHDMVFSRFNPQENEYELTPKGLEIIRQYAKGYISYSRGKDPKTFPNRIDEGEIPHPADIPKSEHSNYTKVIRCEMEGLQLKTYNKKFDGTKSKNNIYMSNMVLPNPETGEMGLYTNEDIENKIANAPNKWLKSNGIQVMESNDGLTITGDFLKEKNLRKYSMKYWTLLQNIKESYGKEGGPIFIYIEDIVGVGLNMVQQLLVQNGFLEYLSDTQKNYNENTIDSVSGLTYGEYKKKLKKGEEDKFLPAKFISIYGESEMKRRNQLIEKFNAPENADGSLIKVILGSRVTRESIDFKNIKQIHILNAQWEFGSLEQIIGRGIRTCSHVGTEGEKRNVYVYKYVSSLPSSRGKYNESIEERLYREQEKVDILIKKIERVLKESAVDCVLNKYGNVFPEEIDEYKKCETKGNKKKCSPMCEYQDCDYKCDFELPRTSTGYYRDLEFRELDKSTYNINFAGMEVSAIKDIIMDLYKKSTVYTIKDLLEKIYEDDRNKYLEKQYILYALNELVENKENVIDQFGMDGYLIYRGKYYIYQPARQSENINLEDRLLPSFDKRKDVRKLDEYIKELLGKDVMKIKGEREKVNIDVSINTIISHYADWAAGNYEKLPFHHSLFAKNKKYGDVLESYILGNIPPNILEKIFRDIIVKPELLREPFYKWLDKNLRKLFITRADIESVASLSIDRNLDERVGYQLRYGKPIMYIGEAWKDATKYLSQSCKRRFQELSKMDYENEPEFVGFMGENKDEVALKLRPRLDKETLKSIAKDGFLDRRKVPSGFVCRQSSDKKKIMEILRTFDLDYERGDTIGNMCHTIEMGLRLNQLSNKGGKKWIYEWVGL
jgi:superfamily II DNA or RNA helicase